MGDPLAANKFEYEIFCSEVRKQPVINRGKRVLLETVTVSRFFPPNHRHTLVKIDQDNYAYKESDKSYSGSHALEEQDLIAESNILVLDPESIGFFEPGKLYKVTITEILE